MHGSFAALARLALALILSACATTGGDAPPTVPPVLVPEPATAPPPEPDPARAEPTPEMNPFDACDQPKRRDEILVDRASRHLLQTVCGSALWFDGLFGERDLDSALRSHGRVEVSAAYSDFAGRKTRLRFHVRTRLPALEQRLSAFVGLDDEDDFVRDRSEGVALRSQRDTDRNEFLAGLGFVLATTDRFQSDFKFGARNPREPKVFVQNRLRYIPYSDASARVFLRLTPFWNNRDGLGVTAGSDIDRTIGETLLLRWANIATITEQTAGLDWRSTLILYQNLEGTRAVAYETFIRGLTDAPEVLTEYGARTVIREPFYNGSLFGEMVLGYSWPRDDPTLERDGALEVGLGVEMPFGLARDD